MKLGVYKLDHRATVPEFKTEQAACFDIVAIDREIHRAAAIYSTGLAFEIPAGYCLEIFSRSGHGFNEDLRLVNSVGVIDADYKGELKVKLAYDGPAYLRPSWPMVGDRVAQGRLKKLVKTDIVEVFEQTETERGAGAFGSTGK